MMSHIHRTHNKLQLDNRIEYLNDNKLIPG